MRRLSEAPGGPGHHRELVRFSPAQRLFVQRWLELFDWQSDIRLQLRPVAPPDVEAEVKQYAVDSLHGPLLHEEVAAFQGTREEFSPALVNADPLKAAERLAIRGAGIGFHPQYLFHAIKILLANTPDGFEARLGRLLDWWKNAQVDEYTFYFRTNRGGVRPPIAAGAKMTIVPWAEAPDDVRLAAPPEWGTPSVPSKDQLIPPHLLRIVVSALDANTALENAIRAYYDYRACVRAASPSLRPFGIELKDVVRQITRLADKTRALPIVTRRFEMRAGRDRVLFGRLHEAAQRSQLFATFLRNTAEAIEHLRQGDLDSALEALVLNQDLAFYGASDTKRRNYARYLIEKGSRLFALDWPRRYFEYITVYCAQTSHTVTPQPGISDPRLSRVLLLTATPWPILTDDAKWARVITRASWDELLKHRRDDFVGSLRAPGATLASVQRATSWDLARAVRARNSLVHEGSYLRHHHTLGILLEVYELVLRLRLRAIEQQPDDHEGAFRALVREIDTDFEHACANTFTKQTTRSWCEEGWNQIWSDPPEGPASTPASPQ